MTKAKLDFQSRTPSYAKKGGCISKGSQTIPAVENWDGPSEGELWISGLPGLTGGRSCRDAIMKYVDNVRPEKVVPHYNKAITGRAGGQHHLVAKCISRRATLGGDDHDE